MTDILDSFFRQYDKAVRLDDDAREEMTRDFLKKYPDTDIDKFGFEVSVDQDLNVEKNIYYKIDDTASYDITSDIFKNNKKWTKYLTINKKIGFGIWSPKDELPKFQNLRYPNLFIYLFIYLTSPTRAGSPQQLMPITVGPHYLTHPVNFPCGRKPEYPEKTHDLPQSVDLCSSHMRTGSENTAVGE